MEYNQNNEDLTRAIFQTLAFFDLFDYPLTGWEVYKFLLRITRMAPPADRADDLFSKGPRIRRMAPPADSADDLFSKGPRIRRMAPPADSADDLYQKRADFLGVKETLGQLVDSQQLGEKFGFYFLGGREASVEIRRNRYKIAEGKFKIVLKAVKWWRWLSDLKMVAVCNNLAYSNANESSDLDVFIIVAAGRLWLMRLLITLITQLLGRRRHGQKVANRICLSFYITTDRLNLKNITLEPADPYFYFWLATLSPVYDNGVFEKFWQSNGWLKQFLPNSQSKQLTFRRQIVDSWFIKIDKQFDKMMLGSKVGGWLEKIAKKIQLKKMGRNIEEVTFSNDTRVIISDTMLKFHEQDRRAEYCVQWLQKIGQ